jgi:hypothetical protein
MQLAQACLQNLSQIQGDAEKLSVNNCSAEKQKFDI